MNVPFLDLKSHHLPFRGEISRAIEEVIDNNAFAGGPFVDRFEEEFAAYCGARHSAGVGSGTEALWLALLALGVKAGDEVITVPNTFIATAEAITYCGAKPVFVDVDERTYEMNPDALEQAVTSRTKAIIPVHLFGQPADMDPILEFARKHGLHVIEDAAQAHGAEYKGRRVGTLGDVACFSFYPGKNLGAFGEGGAVVTDNTELDEKIKILRDHGQAKKYIHSKVGWNCRMDGIQAAVLSIKLRHLDRNNELRHSHALQYDRALEGIEGIIIPARPDDILHVYHIYAIRLRERDEVMKFLASRGIACGIHYPVPLHLQDAYEDLGYEVGAFPVAEKCAREFISLPMFPELTSEQVSAVVQAVQEAVEAVQPGLVA